MRQRNVAAPSELENSELARRVIRRARLDARECGVGWRRVDGERRAATAGVAGRVRRADDDCVVAVGQWRRRDERRRACRECAAVDSSTAHHCRRSR